MNKNVKKYIIILILSLLALITILICVAANRNKATTSVNPIDMDVIAYSPTSSPEEQATPDSVNITEQTSDSTEETISKDSVSESSVSSMTVSDNTISNNAAAEESTDSTSNNNVIEENTKQLSEDDQYLLSLAAGTVLSATDIDSSNIDKYFRSYELPDNVIKYISGKSFQENDNVKLSDLRYIKLLHYNFSGNIQVGELIVNKDIANDIVSIFKELYQNQYQIEKMYLVDKYWTGEGESTDTASIDVNNTSSFLYRAATGSSKLSKHAYGRAIDINPQQNPYVSYKSGSPKWYHDNANDFIDRSTGLAHMITHDDICYQIFKKYGFTWGGDWNTIKDYQHFEK